MNWQSFNTYGDAPHDAFETLCNHLFRNYVFRSYADVVKFRVVNGSGGDGGVEAYAQLVNQDILAVQSKWFRDEFGTSQIGQIRSSIDTAMSLRPAIKKYIVCIPRDLTSIKYTRGSAGGQKQVAKNSEDQLIENLEAEMKIKYPDLEIIWWLEEALQLELTHDDNEGLHKYWFAKEVIGLSYLLQQFEMQKAGWLNERYVPQLHAQGFIQQDIAMLTYSAYYRSHIARVASWHVVMLRRAVTAINKFGKHNPSYKDFNTRLSYVRTQFIETIDWLVALSTRVKAGEPIYTIPDLPLSDMDTIIDEVVDFGYDHQDTVKMDFLINSIQQIHRGDLPAHINQLKVAIQNVGLLVLCGPGTGKTHGLAFAVEQHLAQQSPAMIIPAFGTPCNSWAEIIGAALELSNWSINEILNALEAVATRNDRRLARTTLQSGEELNHEPTQIMIAVDGLEEDIMNRQKWNARIKECMELGKKFRRVKFIFSARPHFYKDHDLPATLPLWVHELPAEGDVPIQKLALQYFNRENYNISITSPSLIRGIDSLFALRLFCDIYKGTAITESDQIVTAGTKLLAKKIERMNAEFQLKINKQLSEARNTAGTAINILADKFLKQVECEHTVLVDLLRPALTYLNEAEIDLLLDYLSHNGILTKKITDIDHGGVLIAQTDYFITYRSIIEIVVANRTIKTILNENQEQIPPLFFERLQPAEDRHEGLSDERIVQIVANAMFHEHGKLIGENNFLTYGFNEASIQRMQREALRKAPAALALKYKNQIDKEFWGSHDQRYKLLLQQILPGSESAENNFGALYLHDILMSFPSSYERDKIWIGHDCYGRPTDITYKSGLVEILTTYSKDLYLSEYALHNETPLIFAWCLSTFDQQFRTRLQRSLTIWATVQTHEFVLLLDLIFDCKDPQIQEDMASITLALAGRLKDENAILELAQWTLRHVFSAPLVHRNVIVRMGFRAIVERAYQYKLIGEDDVKLCRPRQQSTITLLPLDDIALNTPKEEIYPITHDLAWYVIDRATDGFLQYPAAMGGTFQSKDSPAAQHLLDLYRQQYGQTFFASTWRMAAAIAYIRGLGFDPVKGNSITQESHGRKSRVYTYEEKYTWLAVHYLKGYLADYVPYKEGDRWAFIEDYSRIVHIPNPGEDLDTDMDQPEIFSEWVQEESLFEVSDSEPAQHIETEVNREPIIDFSKWLHFNEDQFYLSSTNEPLTALYNYTSTEDDGGFVYGRMLLTACLIPKGSLGSLINVVQDEERDPYFVIHLDTQSASPDTDIYSNPSDLVWMNWIGEKDTAASFLGTDKEVDLTYALTKVTRNTVDGEEYLKIPCRTLRNVAGMVQMDGAFLLDKQGAIIAFLHKLRRWNRENQEIVLVNKQTLLAALENNNLELVWFAEMYKEKQVSVPEIELVPHVRKCRKYLVYLENGQLKSLKFWDEQFSNARDINSEERMAALVAEVKQYDQFTADEIHQVESLIIKGGEVNAQTLPARLKTTEAIAIFKDGETIIATASIKKHPRRYVNNVFSAAGVPEQADQYELELGYVVTSPRYRGRHLSRRLCQELMRLVGQRPVYATIRMTNVPMYMIAAHLGFEINGGTYANKAGTDQLGLYVYTPPSAEAPALSVGSGEL